MNKIKLIALVVTLYAIPALSASTRVEHSKLTRSSGTELVQAQVRGPITVRPVTTIASPSAMVAPLSISGHRNNSSATSDSPTIYGSLLLSQAWDMDNAAYGIYSFPAVPDFEITCEHDGYLTNANGGGTYANSRYYMYYWFEASGVIFTYFRVFDTDTWSAIYSERTTEDYVATDMTYDRTTEKIYGCYYNFTNGNYYFGTSNMSNGVVTILGTYKQPLFALAADVNGDLYGISSDGKLNRVSKTDGSLTVIGATGLTPAYTQSMTFDFKTNKLYWAAVTSSVNGLYEVDITSGKASLISNFNRKEEFGGIFIKNAGASASAPGELTAFTADYDITSDTDIKVSFTLPAVTFDGTSLTGQLDWTIRVNDVDIEMGTGTPGSKVEYTVKGTPIGYATVTAFASNEIGDGPESRIRKWVGRDNPQAVQNLKSSVDGKNVTLSWEAPVESEHGGYFDAQALTYKIIRQPGNVSVCSSTTHTAYVDNVDVDLLTSFYYEVTAFANSMSSSVATSAKVLVGEAFTPPYKETFTNALNFELFTVIDANNDGKTWTLENNAVRGAYSFVNDMDDWLISPPIKLSDKNLYQVCISARTYGYTERFEVKIGTQATLESMTETIIPMTAINTGSYTDYKGDFIPSADGTYYVGIHHASEKERNTLYINKLELIKLTSTDAPSAPDNFIVTPAAKGELSATITFDVPTKSIDGIALTDVTSAKLYKSNRILKNFTDIKPGQSLSYTDNACSKGFNEYRVVVSGSTGDGRESTASAFVGPDVPSGAVNIKLVEDNGRAHLTWDAPTSGVNGGYIDADNLKYHVSAQDFVNGGTKVMAQNLTTREFWDTPTISGQQGMAAYYVYAVNSEGVGYGYRSNVIVMGTPYPLPFKESFKGTNLKYDTWRFENSVGDNTWGTASSGTYPACAPYDMDEGIMTFQPIIEGAVSTILSGIIDISTAQAPVYELYYYHNRLGGDKVSAVVSTNGYDIDVLKTVNMGDDNSSNGWRKISVSLDNYKDCNRLQVGIKVEAGNYLTNVHFDNIVVRDKPERDLSVTGLGTPQKFVLGSSSDFSVAITNLGEKTADRYRVALIRNGEEVASQTGVDLAPDMTAYFSFAQTPDHSFGEKPVYNARVYFDGDNNPANDTYTNQTVFVEMPPYPVVDDLTATFDDASKSVTLNWTAPDIDLGARVTDSFESYDAFSIFKIGDWMTIDVDKQYTALISNVEQWPNAGQPQAYIVFNAEQAGLADDYNDGSSSIFLALEGKQMLICFSSDEMSNDDWLISPRLNGMEQEITFFAKSLSDYYGTETWEFLTSTNEFRENTSEFKKLTEGSTTEQWKKISITVPAGTTYFAIRCTSSGAFGLCIDDVSYTPKAVELKLEGYHVYCNDKCMTSAPITTTGFVHNDVDPESSYRYNIVCVYDKGESAYSNSAHFGINSVNDITTDGIRIYTTPGTLHLRGAQGENYRVVTIDGRVASHGVARSLTDINLSGGIYIVTVGNHNQKVTVR